MSQLLKGLLSLLLLLQMSPTLHPDCLCCEVTLPLATTPYRVTTNSHFLCPPVESPYDQLAPLCQREAEQAHTWEAQPSSSPESPPFLLHQTPPLPTSAGGSLQHCCVLELLTASRANAPLLPASLPLCCPILLQATPKECRDSLLHHLNGYFLSCLLCLPEVFAGRESSFKSGARELAQRGPNPGLALFFYGS